MQLCMKDLHNNNKNNNTLVFKSHLCWMCSTMYFTMWSKKKTNVVKNKIVQEANNNNEINNTDRKKCKSSIQKFIVIL